jgi:hypothetical protein
MDTYVRGQVREGASCRRKCQGSEGQETTHVELSNLQVPGRAAEGRGGSESTTKQGPLVCSCLYMRGKKKKSWPVLANMPNLKSLLPSE